MEQVEVTLFKNIFDTDTSKHYVYGSFDEFETLLYSLSKKPLKSKKDALTMSPAVYKKGTTRANDNVIAWAGWTAIDVDNIDFGDYGDHVEAIKKAFPSYKYVCYSTASCRKDKLKFRIVFPLTSYVAHDKISHFWYALNREVGQVIDKQTKDMSRMFYIPATYKNAFNFIFTSDGEIMNPDRIMDKHDYAPEEQSKNFLDRLPKHMQEHVINQRKKNLTNRNYSWTTFKDCPFVNPKMLEHYTKIAYSDGSGRYHMFYKLMVSIAGNAIQKGYPITKEEIEEIMRGIDLAHSNIYSKRPILTEADRAIEYAYRNSYNG